MLRKFPWDHTVDHSDVREAKRQRSLISRGTFCARFPLGGLQFREELYKNAVGKAYSGDIFRPRKDFDDIILSKSNCELIEDDEDDNNVIINNKPVRTAENKVLYLAKSWGYSLDEKTLYTRSIGLGLFSYKSYASEDVIGRFKGEIISCDSYKTEVAEGRGGFAIYLNSTTMLNCFAFKHICYASYSNDYRFIKICKTINGEFRNALESAKIVVSDVSKGAVYLVATKYIPAHTEIFINYGNDYVFPNILDTAN
jgi:hypothetical protein